MFNVTFLHFDEANRPYDSTVDISFIPESVAFDSYEEAAAMLKSIGYKQNPALNLWTYNPEKPVGTVNCICHALVTKSTRTGVLDCRTECHISTEGHAECAF